MKVTGLDVLNYILEQGRRFDTLEIIVDTNNCEIAVKGTKAMSYVDKEGYVQDAPPMTFESGGEYPDYDDADNQIDQIQVSFSDIVDQLHRLETAEEVNTEELVNANAIDEEEGERN